MRLGRADEALPGPGERVRGRLVAGEDEGQELVADLAVAQFLAVLGPGQEELGEDVAALAEVVGAAAAGDHRVGRTVEEVERDPGESDRLVAEEVHQLADLGDRLGRDGDQALGREPQPVLGGVAARDALDPEDPGHDHVERDRLHPRRQRERPADRPAIDLALGGGRDRTRVALDRLAVKVGEEQLALPHVPGAERGQDRVRADDRRQRRLRRQRRRHLGVGGEERADVIRVADDHQAARHRGPHPEGLAEAPPGAEDELDLALVEAEDLGRGVDLDDRRRGERLLLDARDRPGGGIGVHPPARLHRSMSYLAGSADHLQSF